MKKDSAKVGAASRDKVAEEIIEKRLLLLVTLLQSKHQLKSLQRNLIPIT